jgi:integrase
VRDRQTAERLLRKTQVEIDEGRAGLAAKAVSMTFSQWADQYTDEILAGNGTRPSTRRTYKSTAAYGRKAFERTQLRDIGADDLRRFVRLIRDNEGTDATVAKHLRQLGTMFSAAIEEKVITENPVPAFRKRQNLVIPKGTPPFTDDELTKLWAQMRASSADGKRKVPEVYVTICRFATVTGVRIGEAVALNWSDLELGQKLLHVRSHWDPIDGRQEPKDKQHREVYLIPAAVKLLEEWTSSQGVKPDDSPLFPAPRTGARIDTRYLHRLVERAMTKAGIPKAGADGRPRKPLHSLRASFARILREQGTDPQWIQQMLGHSTIDLTIGVYSAWSTEALRRTADAAEVAFPI